MEQNIDTIRWSENLNKALNAIDAVDTFVSIMRQRRAVCNPAEWDELDAAIEACKSALDGMRKQVYVTKSNNWSDDDMHEAFGGGAEFVLAGDFKMPSINWLENYKASKNKV